MVKVPQNNTNQNRQFDESSHASSMMMKGGGSSDMFDGQSIADSHHFMTKDNTKPIDGMSIADSDQMIREDEDQDVENKAFVEEVESGPVFGEDVTSHGTFMDKASPYKFVDDSSETSPMPKFLGSENKKPILSEKKPEIKDEKDAKQF